MKIEACLFVIVSFMLQTTSPYAGSSGQALFSPDGTIVADPQRDETIVLRDVASGNKVATLYDPYPQDQPRSMVHSVRLSFSPDAKLLATQRTWERIVLWNVHNGSKLATLAGAFEDVSALQFSPDSRLILAIGDSCIGPACRPNQLTVWKIATQKEVFHVALGENAGFKKATFSSDAKVVMAFAGQRSREDWNTYVTNSIILWDIEQGKELATLEADSTTSASFSRDGRSLLIKDTAFGGPRGWDIRAGKMTYFEHYIAGPWPRPHDSGQRSGAITADNVAESIGNEKWNWTVFIKGDPKAIAQVDRVQYTLHPTFPNPVRLVRDRGDLNRPFGLSATGWGTFTVGIRVFMKDGSYKDLEHKLKI